MRKPNLFLIGAPRTGTTALATWLSSRQDVWFSPVKEPGFFCPDFYRPYRRLKEDTYLSLFAGASASHIYVAEGSTRYLYSDVAVPAIERWAENPKYIAIVRNPVELVHSLHNLMVFGGAEQHADFEKAWRLSDARKKGHEILRSCSDPSSLVYTEMGRLGRQIERLFNVVPESRRKVLVYDDLLRDASAFYREVLDFLGLDDDGRQNFAVINSPMASRSQLLGDAIRFLANIKYAMGLMKSFNILGPLSSLNSIDWPRKELSPEVRAEVQDFFREDVALLSRLLGRDLSDWHQCASD